MPWLRRNWLRLVVHVGALAPFVLLVWDGAHHHLTVNPIQEITFRTGKTALVLLTLTLACTPLNTVVRSRQVALVRRPLGLYAFFYAVLHFLTFTVLDYTLDPALIWNAVVEKRYVLAGFSAFVLLVPLAITSTKGWQRRLRRGWTRLHRLVYVAALLVILHYTWLVKADRREPLTYGAVIAGLLVLRLPPVRRALFRFRSAIQRERVRVRPRPAKSPLPLGDS